MEGRHRAKTPEEIAQEKADEEMARRLQEEYDSADREARKRPKTSNHNTTDEPKRRETAAERRLREVKMQHTHKTTGTSSGFAWAGDCAKGLVELMFLPQTAKRKYSSPPVEYRRMGTPGKRLSSEAREIMCAGDRDFDENDYETLVKLEDVKVGLDKHVLSSFPCYAYRGRHIHPHQEPPEKSVEVIVVDDDDDDDDDDDGKGERHKSEGSNNSKTNPTNTKKEAEKKVEEEEEVCPICLEKFEFGDYVRRLPCLDLFHMDCIDKWLSESTKCPVCRIDCRQELDV